MDLRTTVRSLAPQHVSSKLLRDREFWYTYDVNTTHRIGDALYAARELPRASDTRLSMQISFILAGQACH